MPANSRWDLIQHLRVKIVKNPGNGRLNNLNDPVLIVLRKTHTTEGAFALRGCYTAYVGSTLSMFRKTYKFYLHGWRN